MINQPSDKFRDAFITLNNILDNTEGVATIFGREKSLYSQKQKLENLEFKNEPAEVLDKIAFTIVLDNSDNPSKAINKIFNKLINCEKFEPLRSVINFKDYLGLEQNQQRIKKYPENYTIDHWKYRVHDYITYPKKNGYSSFHCGFKYNGTPIEIHIETKENFIQNNFGSADHNFSYKAKPKTLPYLAPIFQHLEVLPKNFSENFQKFIGDIQIQQTNSEFSFYTDFKNDLEKFNIDLDKLVSEHKSDEDIFKIISEVANRYLLHECIINNENNQCDFIISDLKKYAKQFNIDFNDFFRNSVTVYCNYLEIETTGNIINDLQECIRYTNPVLYEYDNMNMIPVNKKLITEKLEGYSQSVNSYAQGRTYNNKSLKN